MIVCQRSSEILNVKHSYAQHLVSALNIISMLSNSNECKNLLELVEMQIPKYQTQILWFHRHNKRPGNPLLEKVHQIVQRVWKTLLQVSLPTQYKGNRWAEKLSAAETSKAS